MSGRTFTAWFTAYPKTHEKRGQTVEVVPREILDAALTAVDVARREAEGYRDAYNAVNPLASGNPDRLPWERDSLTPDATEPSC